MHAHRVTVEVCFSPHGMPHSAGTLHDCFTHRNASNTVMSFIVFTQVSFTLCHTLSFTLYQTLSFCVTVYVHVHIALVHMGLGALCIYMKTSPSTLHPLVTAPPIHTHLLLTPSVCPPVSFTPIGHPVKVVFIDEVDCVCRQRSSSEEEHTRRIKTELLRQMEGADTSADSGGGGGGGGRMFLLCATNCPWELDGAFIRRFQKRIYVPLPSR